ncbi:MAG: hypothetical protein ACLQBA_13035 [Candidatus Binataceae bacterium]
MTDAQALLLAKAMEPNLAGRSAAIKEFVNKMDPKGTRLTNAKNAKRVLSGWAALDNRDAATTKQWSDNLDTAQQQP